MSSLAAGSAPAARVAKPQLEPCARKAASTFAPGERGQTRARSGRHEEARLRALEHDACQPSGCKGAGIDIDPVRQYLGLLARRMSVNDDPTDVHRAFEKLVANPQQIFDALSLQRDAGPHARMAKENTRR